MERERARRLTIRSCKTCYQRADSFKVIKGMTAALLHPNIRSLIEIKILAIIQHLSA